MSEPLPVVCMECGITYKHLDAGRPLFPGEYSSGYCPACLPAIEERWYGRKLPVNADVEALR